MGIVRTKPGEGSKVSELCTKLIFAKRIRKDWQKRVSRYLYARIAKAGDGPTDLLLTEEPLSTADLMRLSAVEFWEEAA